MKGRHPSTLAVLSYPFPQKNGHLISFPASYCSELCVNKCEKGAMLQNTSHGFHEFGITKHILLKQAFMFLSVFIHNSPRVKFALKLNFFLFVHRFLMLISPSCVSIHINKHILIHRYVKETWVLKNYTHDNTVFGERTDIKWAALIETAVMQSSAQCQHVLSLRPRV